MKYSPNRKYAPLHSIQSPQIKKMCPISIRSDKSTCSKKTCPCQLNESLLSKETLNCINPTSMKMISILNKSTVNEKHVPCDQYMAPSIKIFLPQETNASLNEINDPSFKLISQVNYITKSILNRAPFPQFKHIPYSI